jgi:hypothetical protein
MTMRKEKTAKGIWDALAKRHVDEGLVNKILLTWKFFMFQMGPTNTMEVRFNKLTIVADELETIGVAVLDEVKVMVLLISLSDIYQNLITTLKKIQPTNWTWDVVNTRLLNEERMNWVKGKSQQGEEVMTLMTKRSNS